MIIQLASIVCFCLAAAALSYAVLAYLALRPQAAPGPALATPAPSVTILKPLCGAESELKDNLESFFDLDYPDYEIIFGARDPRDPALSIVRALMARYPHRRARIVTDPAMHGTNPKISNLINMEPFAKAHILVVADSDIRVPRTYLQAVVPPLQKSNTGAVTCLYHARLAAPTFANRLARLHIDDWFLPSVLVARVLGKQGFCLGATIAIRRSVLAEIGGFAAFRDLLADDHAVGANVAAKGYDVALAPCVVETLVAEPGIAAVLAHELRWARTIRTVEPIRFAFIFLTYTISVCLAAGSALAALGAPLSVAAAIPAAGVLMRLALHRRVSKRLACASRDGWLLPVRDIVGLCVWAHSFLDRRVIWRGTQLRVNADGSLSNPTKGPVL